MADPTILCTGGSDDSGKACQSEPRLTFRNTENSCGIDVSNTEPEDTGRWILTAVTLTSSGSTQVSKNIFMHVFISMYYSRIFFLTLEKRGKC